MDIVFEVHSESEALLVQFVIEKYFTAMSALNSNSGCIDCRVLIAAFHVPVTISA